MLSVAKITASHFLIPFVAFIIGLEGVQHRIVDRAMMHAHYPSVDGNRFRVTLVEAGMSLMLI